MSIKFLRKHPEISRLYVYIRPYMGRLIVAMACMIIVAFATAFSAYLVKPVLDDIFLNKDAVKLMILPFVVIALYLVKGGAMYGQRYLMAYIGQRIVANIRRDMYYRLQDMDLSYFFKNSTGAILSRLINDVNLLRGAVSGAVTSLLRDFFTIVGLIFVVFYRNWQLACIAMLVLPIAVYPIIAFGRKFFKFSTRSQETIGDLSMLIHEAITGIRIVKAFGMEEYEKSRFDVENERLFRIYMRIQKVRALSSPVMETLGGLGIAAIIWIGGFQVLKGHATPGTFFSFMTALFMLYQPIKKINKSNSVVQEGLSAAKRIFDVIDTEQEIVEAPHPAEFPRHWKTLAFDHVSFAYDKEIVLQDITFHVRRGEMVAFVGRSGSGKTTILNLIPRFHDVTEGRITFDGRDIREFSVRSLRSQIAMVTQEIVLFNDTVRNNIAYGNKGESMEEIVRASKLANAHDFIMKLPQGYDTVIGEKGVKLSGGERQRISIARAILKNAPLLILDEATSSLDAEAEVEVQEGLNNLMENRTVLIVAHRLSTVVGADRIYVLEDGRIVEEGTHESLFKAGGPYRQLFDLQVRNGFFLETPPR
jgi:subfamily B ATP-binding cassette protein MsbA